jgi:starch synthase
MRVLFATSEAYPLAKSGGLADVSRALPIALRQEGVDVRLVLPGYNSAIAQLARPKIEAHLPAWLGEENASLVSGLLPNSEVPVWLIYAPSLYSRPGGLYQDASHQDWDDNPRRFSYFGRVAAALAMGRLLPWKADIVHANDWHAGLLPFYLSLAGRPRPATVFTIHNIAFQGNFPRHAIGQTRVPEQFFVPDGVEFYGQLSFLKAALRYCDKITTVSRQYRQEVMTAEYGCGFDGLLQSRREDFRGIINGIEDDIWDPAADRLLPQCYSRQDISGKRVCKAELQREVGLDLSPDVPLIGFSSRLTHQKMADVLVELIPDIMTQGAQLAVMGDGEPALEKELLRLKARYPGSLAYCRYREELAHRLQAGADILLAPARYEPCGLTQLYALRYGTVPVVRRTGGLADTVTDARSATLSEETATGFAFEDPSRKAFGDAIERALRMYREPLLWRRLQLAGMKRESGWKVSALEYLSLYEEASGLSRPRQKGYSQGGELSQREVRSAQGWT